MKIAGTISGILARKGLDRVVDSTNRDGIRRHRLDGRTKTSEPPLLENNRLIGIISERDYTRKVILKGKSSQETRVEEIMTQDLVTADPTDSVVDCMRVMTEERVRHLPVIKGAKMVGVLAIGDLVKCLISAQAETIDNLEQYLTGAILD